MGFSRASGVTGPVTVVFRLTLALAAILPATAAGPNIYVQHNLVSDVAGLADVTDSNLVNPWGISTSAASFFWVSNWGKGNSTLYNGSGTPSATIATIPPSAKGTAPSKPTGQVSNGSTVFLLPNGNRASFIFVTEDGAISGWNTGTLAITMVDNSGSNAVYKGLAIGASDAGPALYVPNFFSGAVEVYDGKFARTTVSGGFNDPNLPSGFAPFNVWALGGKLYVMYAKQNAAKTFDVPGPGNGYVNVFDMNGVLQKRLISGGQLNSPWGVAIAPATFGAFANDLLVGNFGNGVINAFDINTGEFHGTLQNASGNPIVNTGLWGLLLGNGGNGGDRNTIYFVAGINVNGAVHGLLGAIAPPSAVTGIFNGASQVAGPISPGEVVILTGLTIGPSPISNPAVPTSGSVGTTVANASVTFNGWPAPVLYASASQTSVIVPYEVAGFPTANIVAKFLDQTTATFQATLANSAPGLFTANFTGTGAAVAFNQNGTQNATANAAAKGSIVYLYATGEGITNPPSPTGVITDRLVHVPVLPVTLSIDGKPALVLYAGSSPGQVAGVMEIVAIVPSNAATGAVPVVLTVDKASSPAGVTISVR